MKPAPTLLFKLLSFLALLLCGVSSVRAQTPKVLKVDPPVWFIGHSINPVRVLIRGKNLGGARVTSLGAGLSVGPSKTNTAGTYIFVDGQINPAAKPCARPPRVTTAN